MPGVSVLTNLLTTMNKLVILVMHVNCCEIRYLYFLRVKVLIFIYSLADVDFVTADKIFANDKCCWRGPDTGAVPARHYCLTPRMRIALKHADLIYVFVMFFSKFIT